MWTYEKRLQYPVKIKQCNPKLAAWIMAQYGGPDGELGATQRYWAQKYTMVTPEAIATLNDIATEEMAHQEMIGAIYHQLTAKATPREMADAGLGMDYVNHAFAVHPSAGGQPWTAAYVQSKGDPITDLYENMAAEQKARSTYEHLLNLIDDPDVADPIKFLREREVVHMQRFGESLRYVREYMDSKRMFYGH